MKRIAAILSTVVLLLAVMLPMNAFATSAWGSLSGPRTVRAGDTITVTFSMGGSGLYGVEGSLKYDSSKLTFQGMSQRIGSPWIVNCSGTTFVGYDNAQSSPIKSGRQIFSARFKVKSSASVGSKISVSVSAVGSDGNSESSANASYAATIAAPIKTTTTKKTKPAPTAPLSSNTNLSSMSVSNAKISPAFKSSITKYTASVDFEVEKLKVSAKAQDPKSKVYISGTKLSVGENTVKVVVKAENGATKTYKITVTRAQDPNYKPSSNNNLKSIKVDGYVLSPVFKPEIKNYIVWLPYETKDVEVKAKCADSKASVKIEGGKNLVVGDKGNKIKVICTAEDDTPQTYTIVAKRAPKSGSYINKTDSQAVLSDNIEKSTPIWLTVVLCVVFMLVGFGICYIIFFRKNKYDEIDDDYDNY